MKLDISKVLEAVNSINESFKEAEKIKEEQEKIKNLKLTNPIVKQLETIVNETRIQNEYLQKQIDLLTEENERQKNEVLKAREAEMKASKETKKANKRFWISLIISIVSVIVSIIFGILSVVN